MLKRKMQTFIKEHFKLNSNSNVLYDVPVNLKKNKTV